MDEKPAEEAKQDEKSKITRSRARHERRKRLRGARRAAQEDYGIELKITRVEINRPTDCESPQRPDDAHGISKSKARRLRKKNKIENESNSIAANSEINTDSGSPTEKISECCKKTVANDVSAAETRSKIDDDFGEIKNGAIESIFATKNSESTTTTARDDELFENEKNLQISESLRPTAKSSVDVTTSKSTKISKNSIEKSNFIITKDSREFDQSGEKNFEPCRTEDTSDRRKITKIPARNERGRAETSDEEPSSSKLTKEIFEESPKPRKTNEKKMSSDGKTNSMEKSREQIKMEREAKKAAKAAAKGKAKPGKPEIVEVTSKTGEMATKKIIDAGKIDEVDGEIAAMTSKLTIFGSNVKPEVSGSAAIIADSKSKAELRAERRVKQEAQRAAKQGSVVEKIKTKPTKPIPEVGKIGKISTTPTKLDDPTKKIVKRAIVKENAHEVNLFKHLYHEREQALIKVPTVNSSIHPAIVRLGVQYANKVIVGSNARCVALLAAVKQLIEDFERPSQADFTRGLEASLQESSAYLHHCRPLAVSMQNALRHLKWQMTQLPATTSDEEAKTKLGHAIDTYIQEQIQLADKAISITIQTKISNGDVILTYGYSSLINKILCDAHDAGRQFRVVVVDGRPWLEGREQLRRLAKHGLECSYVLINALSFIMPGVSKVFLGAHAILANGAVMSRVGTAQVALMAKAFNVPVLVACETHKTCERVQTDSIVYNEIADADELAKNSTGGSKKTSLVNWRGKKSLNLLNLTYDVTPADLVTAVVTELAILPCTSVPVILRIKPSEI